MDRPGGTSTTAVQVVPVGRSGKARLSASPGRIDPTNRAFERSREPLAGEFTFRGRTVFVMVVAGDLNDFEFSRPIRQLVERTGLIHLPATLPLPQRYPYVFEGNSQVLDHILVSPTLGSLGYAYDIVHVNADYADQVSDHDPQVARLRVR